MSEDTSNSDSAQGAIDQDFDDAAVAYEERVADALDGIRTEPVAGSLAIDIVTRQVLFVRRKVADTLAEYYEQEGFDLATYGPHPWLPVTTEDAAYECYYANDLALDGLDDIGDRQDYSFPEGRLAVVPIENASQDVEVGDI